jgi:hypothetical protein
MPAKTPDFAFLLPLPVGTPGVHPILFRTPEGVRGEGDRGMGKMQYHT